MQDISMNRSSTSVNMFNVLSSSGADLFKRSCHFDMISKSLCAVLTPVTQLEWHLLGFSKLLNTSGNMGYVSLRLIYDRLDVEQNKKG